MTLRDLAYARSGDKGNDANIGVIARDEMAYELLRTHLTADVVKRFFAAELAPGAVVERFEWPGLRAFNFVLRESLGGGGAYSLRIDPQGKAFAQRLLDLSLAGVHL